ncbi:hypothetical protein ICE98_02640 [Lactococcus lactis]|nr:hypothetical protein [Lactococcus lactis]
MILRKYLAGAFIEQIEQVENDRQIILHISTKDEIGDSLKIALITEIMGKHSNIILLEKTSQKIIESIKHIGFSQNQFGRFCLAQPISHHPASNATDPFKATDEEIFEALQTEQLQQKLQGIGRDSKNALTGLSVKEFNEKLLTVTPSIYPNDTFSSIKLADDL